MDLHELLEFMVKQNISDIHLKADCAPLIRLHGQLIPTQQAPLTPAFIQEVAYTIMDPARQKVFETEGEIDIAYTLDNVSRFRVNVYRQRGTIALTLRVIPLELKGFSQLNLPEGTLTKLSGLSSGLLLFAGVTGSGKTTTMNSMINHINEHYAYNVISVEDPVEYYHKDKKSSVSQREVGSDTRSFGTALKYILRQDPDVIAIGEMRDPETIAAGMSAAETGHLVLSTIHTIDAAHTIQRIVDSYPPAQQVQIRASVATTLRAVVAQKLIVTTDGKGRVPCTEILIMTPFIRQLVFEGKLGEIYAAIGRATNEGMLTFDQDLLRLCKEGKISRDTALLESTRPDNLMSMLQGISVKL